jgi:hypothetical protein
MEGFTPLLSFYRNKIAKSLRFSHVPHKSLDQVDTIFMPDAAQAVNKYLLDLSWSPVSPPVLTSSFSFRHLIDGSLALVSLNLT